jgi:predicted nucleotidyltransferase
LHAEERLRQRRVEREELLQRVTGLLEGDERVVAAWLFGSLGRGNEDDLSDLDLWVVVGDDFCDEMVAERHEYVTRLGEALLIEEAPQNAPPGGGYLLVLYGGQAGPHQVDWYWQSRSDAQRPPDTRLLFDKAGIPTATPPEPRTQQERAQTAANLVAFFWAMVNIAAKKIARRQAWDALAMVTRIWSALAQVKEIVGSNALSSITHRDFPPGPPPVEPAGQLALLREIAREMEALTPELKALGVDVPSEAIPSIYDFLDLAAAIIKEDIPTINT